MRQWMLYGAYGFTGQLIVEEAVRRGHRPVLAGRNGTKLRALAERYGLDHVQLALDDATELTAVVGDFDLVFHSAGPYSVTGEPMMRACLAGRTHYWISQVNCRSSRRSFPTTRRPDGWAFR
jgi:short subunit dehydrogenase-like uncharacterized protein